MKKKLMALVWSFKGADTELEEERKNKKEKKLEEKTKKEKEKKMIVDAKPKMCLVHTLSHPIGDVKTFQTPS